MLTGVGWIETMPRRYGKIDDVYIEASAISKTNEPATLHFSADIITMISSTTIRSLVIMPSDAICTTARFWWVANRWLLTYYLQYIYTCKILRARRAYERIHLFSALLGRLCILIWSWRNYRQKVNECRTIYYYTFLLHWRYDENAHDVNIDENFDALHNIYESVRWRRLSYTLFIRDVGAFRDKISVRSRMMKMTARHRRPRNTCLRQAKYLRRHTEGLYAMTYHCLYGIEFRTGARCSRSIMMRVVVYETLHLAFCMPE